MEKTIVVRLLTLKRGKMERERKQNNIKEETMSFEVDIKASDLYEFMMYSNYVSIRGAVSVIFSIVCVIGTIIYWKEITVVQRVIMLFMASLFTVVAPLEYMVRAKKQASKNFSKTYIYTFNDSGITIACGEEKSSLPWNQVMKVISTKNLVVIYFTQIRAFILPKRIIGERFNELKKIMEENTSCYKFSMK